MPSENKNPSKEGRKPMDPKLAIRLMSEEVEAMCEDDEAGIQLAENFDADTIKQLDLIEVWATELKKVLVDISITRVISDALERGERPEPAIVKCLAEMGISAAMVYGYDMPQEEGDNQ